jgi:Domain of unknown function (DUF4190)/Septum formation
MTYPPGQPPYYQPYQRPYGQYGQQPAPYPQKQSTSGLAIASLILGIIGFLWFCAVLSVIFGIIALNQTKGGKQQGRGMAIAGLVLSGVWTVILVAVIVAVVVSGESSIRATDVEVGDCLKDVPTGTSEVMRVPKVSCDKQHRSEVFAIFKVPGDEFPGDDVIQSEYGEKCGPALDEYAPQATNDPLVRIDILVPLREGWAKGDRDVVCIATSVFEQTGSIKK